MSRVSVRQSLFLLGALLIIVIPLLLWADVKIEDSPDDLEAEHWARYKTTVFTTNLIGYAFYVGSDENCKYSKTVDGGYTWATGVTIGSCDGGMDIWYDQWTPGDTTGTIIYVTYFEDSSDDVFYRNLDTASDTLSSALNITTGTQLASNGLTEGQNFPSITKATDGELYVGLVDNNDQFVIRCSSNCTANISNWTEAGTGTTVFSQLNTDEDALLLMPLASGNILAIANDTGDDDFLSKVWTDSGSSWDGAWATIDNNAPDNTSANPAMSATLDKSTNTIYLIYAADLVNGNAGDVRSASYASGSWTSKTVIGTNISIPNNTQVYSVAAAYDSVNSVVYAIYGRSTTTTAGIQARQVFYNKSSDGMTTWSATTGPFASSPDSANGVAGLGANFLSPFKIFATWFKDNGDDIYGTIIEDRLTFGTESRITFAGDFSFSGNLTISGAAMAKGSGTFVIDHPLDPKNKLLYHSFVESPQAKNVYDGVATLDENGEVRIELPSYFEALNKDFRYHFFPHFEAMPGLYVKQEVKYNAFVIAGGKPHGEITWQITGDRHDPYILANPIIPEVDKGNGQPVGRGECMYEPLCR